MNHRADIRGIKATPSDAVNKQVRNSWVCGGGRTLTRFGAPHPALVAAARNGRAPLDDIFGEKLADLW